MKNSIEEYIRTVLEIDDPDIIEEFISDLRNLLQESLPGMRTAIEKGDFQALRVLAHTLKGSSANIGAEEIRQISLQLQMASDAQNDIQCKALVASLEKINF